ncbi:MAG: MFS transporter [Gemmatimonadota bacterium]|nr:MFS transporter [Gemmatimonadota bacterium]MDH3477943.1 MFS transporter [Gemmatimonadota bacterium]MDH3571016.1 MFS transporter [Gemmatimonadota bacterium]MDH5549407.1 MFS transporter [Gemmatimonadota bacterium]
MSSFSPYQRRLFIFLSVATFFEGYDFIALSQILPNLRTDFGLSESDGGMLGSVISLGTMVSYILVRKADRWGRRRTLIFTIAGYSTFTFLSAMSQGPYDFTAYQFTARVFLIAQWAVGMIYAAEEYPAGRRGFVIGVIQASNSLGVVTCAAVVPYLLQTQYGWRAVYFVGVAPFALLLYAMRGLRETERFTEIRRTGLPASHSLLEIMRSPYRTRVLQMALIWGLTYLSTNTALLFWKEFAVGERGFSDADVGQAVVIASVVALPFVFGVGKLLDVIGRKRGALLIYSVSAVFVVLVYQLRNFWALTACLTVALVAAIGILTLLNALTTELFPTEMRADAFAWANNLLGRIGYVIAPGVVGAVAAQTSWSFAVPLTAIAVLAALWLILWLIPETGGKELEEAARI